MARREKKSKPTDATHNPPPTNTDAEALNEVDALFTGLNISSEMSRSGATNAKVSVKEEDRVWRCVCCFKPFENKPELKKHLKQNPAHKADKDEVKRDFEKAKKLPRNTPFEKREYQWALARVTMLEHMFR